MTDRSIQRESVRRLDGRPSAGTARVRSASIGLVFSCFALVGCGGAPSEVVETRPQRASGGHLQMMLQAPRTLDPVKATTVHSSFHIRQIFDGLVAANPGLQLRPALARTWTVDPTGTHYTFRLRDGLTFHDGSPVRSDDVVFSIERALSPEHAGRCLAASYLEVIEGAAAYSAGEAERIEGLTAVEDDTVVIRLSRADESFLHALTMDGAMVLPRKLVEAGGNAFFRAPVGTGPFRLSRIDDQGLQLSASDAYFGTPPMLDTIEVTFADRTSDGDLLEALLAGRVDVIVPSASLLPTLKQGQAVQLHEYQEMSIRFVGLKTGAWPLDQRWVRRAIAHAVNRRGMIAEVPSLRTPPTGILPPGIFGFTPEDKLLPYDPDHAKQILAVNGHPGGQDLPEIPIYTPLGRSSDGSVSLRLENDLEAIGIRARVEAADWPTIIERLAGDDLALFVLNWVADTPIPESFLQSLFERDGSANFWDYDDAETAELLRRVDRETDPLARRELFRSLERRVIDMAPFIPLFHTRGAVAMAPRVRGMTPGALGHGGLEMERVWIATGEAS